MTNQSTKDQLKYIIERIERLEEEKAALSSDIKDVYAEAKSNGFDVKALRAIVKIRKEDGDKRAEEAAILATYMHALGMIQVELPFEAGELPRVSKRERELVDA
jgi:uncharacterized protein (UPF0335 family)